MQKKAYDIFQVISDEMMDELEIHNLNNVAKAVKKIMNAYYFFSRSVLQNSLDHIIDEAKNPIQQISKSGKECGEKSL